MTCSWPARSARSGGWPSTLQQGGKASSCPGTQPVRQFKESALQRVALLPAPLQVAEFDSQVEELLVFRRALIAQMEQQWGQAGHAQAIAGASQPPGAFRELDDLLPGIGGYQPLPGDKEEPQQV